MSPAEGRRQAVAFWFEKARRALDSARAENAAGRADFAMNRCYYSAFYAATATLLSRGHRFSKHSGVRAALHRHLVKPGLLPIGWGQFYDKVFEDRQRSDYLDFVSPEPEDVAELIPKVDELLGLLHALVAETDEGPA
ncbi:MAG TPA: HEPN domain-containing protein [Vicinamibacteria bacterium]|nr:HEPN domain-containing protein [Vicinamibacteria bacterium]